MEETLEQAAEREAYERFIVEQAGGVYGESRYQEPAQIPEELRNNPEAMAVFQQYGLV